MPAKVQTMQELQALLSKLGKGALEQAGRALYQEALAIQAVSMKRTPVDTRPNSDYPHTKAPHPGQLRASHETTFPEVSGGEVVVRILVGGPAAGYAVYVHERLDVHHPVGQAKFLESAVLEAARDLPSRLAARIDFTKGAGA